MRGARNCLSTRYPLIIDVFINLKGFIYRLANAWTSESNSYFVTKPVMTAVLSSWTPYKGRCWRVIEYSCPACDRCPEVLLRWVSAPCHHSKLLQQVDAATPEHRWKGTDFGRLPSPSSPTHLLLTHQRLSWSSFAFQNWRKAIKIKPLSSFLMYRRTHSECDQEVRLRCLDSLQNTHLLIDSCFGQRVNSNLFLVSLRSPSGCP
jgi:hypothetical protein